MNIVVTPYQEAWPACFEREAAKIGEILGNNQIRIFHIGSTAVPGLQAKPIIDMLPVVRSITQLDACTEAFEAPGYEVMGEFGLPGRRYMRKGGENRTHQIHAFEYSSTEEILRHVVFRDYLRCHPAVCAAYGELKYRLAKAFPTDIDAYSDGKNDFVKQTERDALQWYWENWA